MPRRPACWVAARQSSPLLHDLAAQRGVQSRQSTGPAEATGNFDGGPGRRRGRPLADHDEGRAIATVHDQAVDRPSTGGEAGSKRAGPGLARCRIRTSTLQSPGTPQRWSRTIDQDRATGAHRWVLRGNRCPAKSVPDNRAFSTDSKWYLDTMARIWPLVATPPCLSNNCCSAVSIPGSSSTTRLQWKAPPQKLWMNLALCTAVHASVRNVLAICGVLRCRHARSRRVALQVGEARRRAAGPQPRSGLAGEFP